MHCESVQPWGYSKTIVFTDIVSIQLVFCWHDITWCMLQQSVWNLSEMRWKWNVGKFFPFVVESKMYKVSIAGFMKTASKTFRPAWAFFSPKSTIKKISRPLLVYAMVRSCYDPFGRLQLFCLCILPCNQLPVANCTIVTFQTNNHMVWIGWKKDVNS